MYWPGSEIMKPECYVEVKKSKPEVLLAWASFFGFAWVGGFTEMACSDLQFRSLQEKVECVFVEIVEILHVH